MDWIKVEDKLPYKDGNSSITCLVCDKWNSVYVRVYNEYYKCWDDEDADDYYTDAIVGIITHWRELPEPPK